MAHRSVETSPLDRWVRVIRLRWPLAAVVFVLVFGLVAAMVFFARPVYRAEARLRLGETPPMGGISQGVNVFGFLRVGGDPFSNDLELFDSRSLVEGVVTDATLPITIDAPAGWHRDSFFIDLRANRETGRRAFEASWTDDGRVVVRMVSPSDSAIGRVEPGAPIVFGGITAVFREHRPGMVENIRITTVPFGESVRLTGQRIVVERTRRDANVVRVTFNHTDPGLAEQVVSSVVSRFLELRTTLQGRESRITVDSLRAVAQQTLDDLRQAESDLQAYQQRTRFIAPGEQNAAFVTRYTETSTAVAEAEAEVAAVDRVLASADSAVERSEMWTKLVSYPRFLQNATIGTLLEQLILLEQQRTELGSRRTEANRETRVLDQQINSLDGALRSLVLGYRNALVQELGSLRGQLNELDSVLVRVPSMSVELGRRQRAVRLLSEVVVLTEQRLRQEELREALTFANVQVIDPPARQYKPVWPRKRLGLVVGFMLAGMFATLAMVVQERADRTVRSANEIREILHTPVLLVVTRNGKHDWDVREPEAASLVRRAGGSTGPARRVVLAGVSGSEEAVSDLARTLLDSGVFAATGAESERNGACGLTVAPPLNGYRSTGQVTTVDESLVLVVECARTTRDQLVGVSQMLEESGTRIAGAIVLCHHKRQADALWS